MGRFKNTASTPIIFDLAGKEKILLPGQSYTLEENEYITGLVAQGIIERIETPEKSDEEEPTKPAK